ncbi:protein NRT1/ PTR FAMILY 5.10-like isoform X2 [Musa acuminata AAA Group]|uniref:protein NRT1/ PTR FAMILY 5.10-like isoform X2 n=1 Tax=Musa acuminata AAA Group TaxID=214697 RepID=UPI0031DA05A4
MVGPMATDPLLSLHRHPSDLMVGVVDYLGRPASRSATGGWTSALFIIVVEVAERFAFFGLSSNLIIYLTGPLNEPTATAAAAISTWKGVACMLPFLGAVVADSYLGRHRTIVIASLLYILGLGMLAVSSALLSFHLAKCGGAVDEVACTPSLAQVALFYASLYLVALAQGGHQPSVQAFAADQFDQTDPEESIARSAFFNWWCFAIYCGILVGVVVLSYVQDNLGFVLGFEIPFMVMLFGLLVFLLGTRTYRFYLLEDLSPFARIGKTLVALARTTAEADTERHQSDVGDVEESKRLLRLFPTWATCLIYAAVLNQPSTFFTKQASTLDRSISSSNFRVPPAALLSLISASAAACTPIYDRFLVPAARRFTGLPSGITMLQRIGIGKVISLISIVVAALVETKRLRTAREFSLVDQPEATIPLSIWWLVPQYVLSGVADAFSVAGLLEFFYDQVPDALRSLGVALFMSIFGVGSFIDGFMISAINKITGVMGETWFSNNLNRAHLDDFYWLLAGLSILESVLYLHCAQAYVYKKKDTAALT